MLKLSGTTHRVYTFLLCFLAFGMPNLNILMSIGVILLFATWLVSPGIKKGVAAFSENKVAVFLAGLFVLHIVWLINTSDFDYALNDLRIKIPLLVLPLVLGSIPITRKQVKIIFLALSLGVWFATISAYFRYFQLPEGIADYRQIVHGVSHIRLSLLMVTLTMAILYFWKELSTFWKVYGAACIINTVLFFNTLQSATGIVILAILLCAFATYTALKSGQKKAIFTTLAVLILGVGAFLFYSVNYYNDYFVAKPMELPVDTKTDRGNEYVTIGDAEVIENGQRIYAFLANDEMIEAWNERSDIKMLSDTDDETLYTTLIRYLTSKGLRKDYAGVMALSDQDLRNIENGYPNEIYANESGLKLRFHSFMFGLHVYSATGNASGASFFQRILFWEVAWNVIKQNVAFGVGTGDVKNAIQTMHQEMHPELDKRYWLRAHNQFLTFFVSFGILGFAYFIGLFAYAFRVRRSNALMLAFLTIAFISCLTEDTLETQAGVTFFAFFFSLLSKPFDENNTELNQ